jgi:DNA-binding transcriptional regulator of glucitol operon
MNPRTILLLLALVCIAGCAMGQWQTTIYSNPDGSITTNHWREPYMD